MRNTAVRSYRSRYIYADTRDFFFVQLFLFYFIQNGLCQIRQNRFALIFCVSRHLPFIQNHAIRVKESQLHGCSADISSKTIFFHILYPPVSF
jgi:hypothetical protein